MMDKKIALFMLAPLTQGGGAEKYFIDLAKNMSEKDDIEADVITFNDGSFRRFARLLHIFTRGNIFGKINDYERGMRERREDVGRELGKACWRESSRKDLGNCLKSYDLIYAKNEIVDLFLLKMIGYRKLPPIIVGVHTPIFYPETSSFVSKLHNLLYASFFYRWLLKGVACVHVSNRSAKQQVEKIYRSESQLIYYPFSVQRINEAAKKNKGGLEFDASKKNIIFVGRLGEQKGIDTLIKFIQKVSGDGDLNDKVIVNIFGCGDEKYETALKKLAKNHSCVRYFGHVENKFIPDILTKQDLMLVPSKWETLPYSVLEAQGMGLPVIAFDIPGPTDIIENRETGFLVKSEEEFMDKIKSLAEGKISLDKNEIIQNIERKFNPEKIYAEMIKMLEDCL